MEGLATSTWRFLFGFYPIEDAVTIAKSQGIDISPEQEASLRNRISRANAFVRERSSQTAPIAKLNDVPQNAVEHLKRLEAESTFGEYITGMTGWSWRFVELANLRTFQPSVNWDYVQKLSAKAPEAGYADDTLKFCIPLSGSMPPQRVTVGFNPVNNTYSIVTEHLDLRIVGQVQGEDPKTKRKFFGFVTGFGLTTMTVAHYKGTYLLKNGYHRALALLAKGHKSVPVLVVETDSYQQTGAAGPGFFSVDVINSSRPPLLSDFLSDAAVDISRPILRTVLTIHAEGQQLTV